MSNEEQVVLKKILDGPLKMHFQYFLFVPKSIIVNFLQLDYYIFNQVSNHLKTNLK
jgi:hypothetical protein